MAQLELHTAQAVVRCGGDRMDGCASQSNLQTIVVATFRTLPTLLLVFNITIGVMYLQILKVIIASRLSDEMLEHVLGVNPLKVP